MANEPIYRRQNDTGPPIAFTLRNPDGSPFDPTGWTLQLQYQEESLDPDTGVWTPGAGTFSIIAPAENGRVDYNIVAADTAVAAAPECRRLLVEALNGSDRRTFPQKGYKEWVVTPQNLDQ